MNNVGRNLPWYGKIQGRVNPEAAAIWRSRDTEIDDCEPLGFFVEHETDEVRSNEIAIGAELWALAEEILTDRAFEMLKHLYIYGRTLDEVAQQMDVSRGRVRQICERSLRVIRLHVGRNQNMYGSPYLTRIPKAVPPVMAWESEE